MYSCRVRRNRHIYITHIWKKKKVVCAGVASEYTPNKDYLQATLKMKICGTKRKIR